LDTYCTQEGFEGHSVKKEKENKRIIEVGMMKYTSRRAFNKKYCQRVL
jgi:hypothetical protein